MVGQIAAVAARAGQYVRLTRRCVLTSWNASGASYPRDGRPRWNARLDGRSRSRRWRSAAGSSMWAWRSGMKAIARPPLALGAGKVNKYVCGLRHNAPDPRLTVFNH